MSVWSRRSLVEGSLLLVALCGLAAVGVWVRHEAWPATEVLRYNGDMENGWNWGSRAAREGYFSLYDRVVAQSSNGQFGLDYLPLRLAAMTLWAKIELAVNPATTAWERDYAFNRPLLRLNTVFEALTAIGLGMIASDWQRRDRRPTLQRQRPLYGAWLAVLVIGFAWLNPASLVSAHVRPTWDVWVTPFYVWAVYSATRNGWLTAGCIVGIGAMCKGQQLFAAPLFLLWPLMRFRIGAAARFAVGFATSVALVASPWMVGPRAAAILFVVLAAALPVAAWAVMARWPVADRRVPARWLRWGIPAAAAIAIGLCVPLFGGSMNWLRVGLIYGADKFKDLEIGRSVSLAGILKDSYRWGSKDRVEALQGLLPGLTISQFMIAIYGLCLLGIAWAASQYEKRGDRRFVLAIAAPWLVYFAVFPQMHERYLLWGAILAGAAVIVNVGMLWLAVFFTLCSTGMSLMQMADSVRLTSFVTRQPTPPIARQIYEYVYPTYPGLAWAVLLATAVWLWVMLAGTVSRNGWCGHPAHALVSAKAERRQDADTTAEM